MSLLGCRKINFAGGVFTLLLSFHLSLSQAVQARSEIMEPTRQRLSSLRSCLEGKGSSIEVLSNGLLFGYDESKWRNQGSNWSSPQHPARAILPPPPAYLESLDRDIAACNAALATSDLKKRDAILDTVRRDIGIKAEDCRQFGMGRLVTVRVITMLDTKTENGWEVYYKWNCVSGFDTDEIRVPGMTSPATVDLSPGEYTIRVEKNVSGAVVKKTGTVVMICGMSPSIDFQIPVS